MLDIGVGVVIGLLGGAAGGLLGIGGGAIFVPGIVILVGTDQILAQGVSLTAIVVQLLWEARSTSITAR